MSKYIPHDFQWSHTENAIYMFHKILEKNIDNGSNLQELFFKTTVCATEKLDGTNVAKDESGQIYGRRIPISKDTKVYQKTSLEAVRSVDIEKVKTVILKETKLEKNSIKKFLLYGELICNHFYDYDKRDLHGKWVVFGARIVGEDNEKIYKQLADNDFYVKRGRDCVLILPNSTFLNIVKSYDMNVPNMIGEKKTIFEIVKENKCDIAKGKIEGIIFTWYSPQYSGSYLLNIEDPNLQETVSHETNLNVTADDKSYPEPLLTEPPSLVMSSPTRGEKRKYSGLQKLSVVFNDMYADIEDEILLTHPEADAETDIISDASSDEPLDEKDSNITISHTWIQNILKCANIFF